MTYQTRDTSLQMLVDSGRAADMLGISRRKLAQLVATGVIPSRKIGRLRRFSVAELDAWVTEGCPDSPKCKERTR